MLPSLCERIKNRLSPSEIQVLIPGVGSDSEDLSLLRGLLIEEPQQLVSLNDSIMAQLVVGYQELELPLYQKARRKKNKSSADLMLVSKYESMLMKLLDAFDYKKQVSENQDRAYHITAIKGVNVCTYCNRQYIFTINKPKRIGLQHIVRPELDHWFNKELFPLLSLSFYNLIPSCHTCNSAVKGTSVFSLSTHINPYLQNNANPDIRFRPTIQSAAPTYGVVIERKTPSKEDNTIKAFALDEIYRVHGGLEVNDLMMFNYAYSDGYLRILFDEILDKYCSVMTKAEIYKMLFGTEMDPKKYSERPLSKMKHDILKYLHIV